MFSKQKLAGIADCLINCRDLMSGEEIAAYLASEYEIESAIANKLVEQFDEKFDLTSIVMEDELFEFIDQFILNNYG